MPNNSTFNETQLELANLIRDQAHELVPTHMFCLALLLKKHGCLKAFQTMRRGVARAQIIYKNDNSWYVTYDNEVCSVMADTLTDVMRDLRILKKGEKESLYVTRRDLINYARSILYLWNELMSAQAQECGFMYMPSWVLPEVTDCLNMFLRNQEVLNARENRNAQNTSA